VSSAQPDRSLSKQLERLLEVTGVKEHLVLVDDPDDLVPPPISTDPPG
jgi:hypothetical protein